MPVPLRATHHKAEVKYNVTTEFPSLGLHAAAATGNIGLVEYALDHGQPINSVLDGVLPLHAACAGGNVQVVKLLIDHGADVNAPRLPRKYFSDKNRDSSAPIVGISGSTPLHFAAANGNTDVVTLLLLHGAHADRPDKHGTTPEMLARQNNWVECGNVLKSWIVNKDRDLREREVPAGSVHAGRGGSTMGSTSNRLGYFNDNDPSPPAPTRKRLHVKHSIDTALNMLKSSSTGLSDAYNKAQRQTSTPTPPASPRRPFGDYTFYNAVEFDSPVDQGARRPSLPHAFHAASDDLIRNRKLSATSTNTSQPRRPRSAGSGGEGQPEPENAYPTYGRGGSGRKLGSKYSLINIFKKGQNNDLPAEGMPLENDQSHQGLHSRSSLTTTSTDQSTSNSILPLSTTPSSSAVPNPSRTFNGDNSSLGLSRPGSHSHRKSDASTRSTSQPPAPQILRRKLSSNARSSPTAIPFGAIDLHHVLVQQQSRDRLRSVGGGSRPEYSGLDEGLNRNIHSPGSSPLARFNLLRNNGEKRNRSGSNGSVNSELNAVDGNPVFLEEGSLPGIGADTDAGRNGGRRGILRGHNRSPSSGQASPAAFRSLRFDSASSAGGDKNIREAVESPMERSKGLRQCNSTSSLAKAERRGDSAEFISSRIRRDGEVAKYGDLEYNSSHHIEEEADGEADQEDFEYGLPLPRNDTQSALDISAIEQIAHTALLMRQRGSPLTSSSDSSLSPILTSDGPVADGGEAVLATEFPFSINYPPLLHGEGKSPPVSQSLHPSLDGRNRGDSLSSSETSGGHADPTWSSSVDGTTSGSATSATVSNISTRGGLSDSIERVPNVEELQNNNIELSTSPKNSSTLLINGLHGRRSHLPLDIDISSISSHAQAEVLVQQALRDAFDALETVTEPELISATAHTGRTPLSARLAAYGGTLVLEKKLRQKEEEQRRAMALNPAEGSKAPQIGTLCGVNRDGLGRQQSLEHKRDTSRKKPRTTDPRRPSTAEGTSGQDIKLSQVQSSQSQTSSRSLSMSEESQPMRHSLDGEHGYNSSQHIHAGRLYDAEQQISANRYARFFDGSHKTDIALELETLSRISSLEDFDTSHKGYPLSRVSTAPLSGDSPLRGKLEARRDTKLRKMGFSPSEARATPTPPPPIQKRFIKSLMQTIKGKT